MRRWLWVALAMAGLGLTLLGLGRGEWNVVKRHANTLCTSCIGLTPY
jgi:hypothetical protein